MNVTPVQRTTLSAQIADHLRAAIQAGDFAEDTRLPPERVLAATFGVSRPSIREALQTLVAAGLVERRQGSGTRIRVHNNDERRTV